MDDQLIKERFNSFGQEYREFLASDFIIETAAALAEEQALTEEELGVFENTLSLYFLCFIDAEEVVQFMITEIGLSREDASALFSEVIDLVPPEVVRSQQEVFTALYETPPEEAVAQAQTVAQTAPVPPAAPREQNPLPPPVPQAPERSATDRTPPESSLTTPVYIASDQESLLRPVSRAASENTSDPENQPPPQT